MKKPRYDPGKVRRAMLVAPAAALLGIVPYIFGLNLSLRQSVLAVAAAALGYSRSMHLMGYATLVVVVLSLLFQDAYVLVSLGPPILLAAGAFCWLRGAAVESAADIPPR